ncbi:hypothetical protein ACFE04_021069 [Oxalis oulophora]
MVQVVLTSTNPCEICINGMSFSRRASKWSDATLVVNGELEQRAAMMGGGNFVVSVQKATGFLENELTIKFVPSSSYRIGLKASFHELFPARTYAIGRVLVEPYPGKVALFESGSLQRRDLPHSCFPKLFC